MDIYQFINSRDIAAYLKNITYQFSAFEMAYLVQRSQHRTLAEKIDAMKTIIAKVPDHKLDHCKYQDSFTSAHDLMRRYIGYIEREFEAFAKSENACFVIEYPLTQQISACAYVNAVFSSLDTCFDFLHKKLCSKASPRKEYTVGHNFIIRKCQINSDRTIASIIVNDDLDPIDILPSHQAKKLDEAFSYFAHSHVQIPVPFNSGDIVIDPTHCYARPFVFSRLGFWDSSLLEKHGIKLDPARQKKHDKNIRQMNKKARWNSIHMMAMGFEQRTVRSLLAKQFVCRDEYPAAENYLDLEYYRDPLADDALNLSHAA